MNNGFEYLRNRFPVVGEAYHDLCIAIGKFTLEQKNRRYGVQSLGDNRLAFLDGT